MTKRFFGSVLSVALAIFFCLVPTTSIHASTVDLSLDSHSISFSEDALYSGDTIRIYARVKNVGDVDASAYVLFYQGGILIGKSQAVSLLASGNPDDVYVDFTIPTGSFNIRAVLQGSSPQDQNPANDTTMTALYSPIVDEDRDGVTDEDDNCANDENADQQDTDGDDLGDVCDSDDDGDGVSDANDQYPLDGTKSVAPAPVVVAAPVTAPAPSASSTATTSAAAASSSTTGISSTDSAILPEENGSEIGSPVTSSSHLTTSPLARFSWKQTDWRTYEFTLADQPEEGVQFSWDFGDGATSVQPQILHAFAGPGTYTVTLAIIDSEGNVLSDAQTFDVTFFHLDNPQVIGLIVLLFIALFSFGFAFIKLRSPYDQGTAHK